MPWRQGPCPAALVVSEVRSTDLSPSEECLAVPWRLLSLSWDCFQCSLPWHSIDLSLTMTGTGPSALGRHNSASL